MFEVGDRVFCPLRGSGVVEAIEERTMLDEAKEYCIIQLQGSNMTVMVPTDRLNDSRFRPISNRNLVEAVFKYFEEKEEPEDMSLPSKERIKVNQAKLSNGTLADCGEVVKCLTFAQKEKSLNNNERAMLLDARKLLSDEISMIQAIPQEQVVEKIDKILG